MNPELSFIASATVSRQPEIRVPRPFERIAESLFCEFKIHRVEEISGNRPA